PIRTVSLAERVFQPFSKTRSSRPSSSAISYFSFSSRDNPFISTFFSLFIKKSHSFSLGSMTFFPGFILMRQKKLTAYFSFLFTFPSIIASVLLLPFVDQVNIIFFHGIHIRDQTVGIAVAALLLCLLIPVLSGNPVINVFCRIAFIRVERIAVTGQDLIDGQLRAGMHHFHTGVHHAVQFRLGQQP